MSRGPQVKFARALIVAIGLTAPVVPRGAAAVGTSFWTSEGVEEFLQGETQDAVVTGQGDIAPGPTLERVLSTGESYLWALAAGDGGSLYLATGTHGRLFRVENGRAADTLRQSDEEEAEIFAVARAKDGGVIYGLSPSGLVMKKSRGRAPDTLAHFEDQYVWAILPRPSGDIVVATGQPGRVWRIPGGGGQAEKLFESDEEHVLSLAAMPDGKILAGTGNRGLLFEITGAGNARVLFDAPQKEIKAIVPLPGGVIALAAGGAPGTEASASADSDAEVPGGGGGEPPPKAAAPAVYAIRPNGSVERWWRSPEDVIHSMVLEPGGTLLVGTGNRGRVYRLTPDADDVGSLVATVDEPQVVSLIAGTRESFFGTSNPAVLYRLSSEPSKSGVFTSRVFDAGQISRWGSLHYDLASGTGRGLRFECRSGNLEDPEKGWSSWAPPGDGASGQIPSPPGRFLQWRVKFEGGTDRETRLARVRIAYLPPNLPPRIARLAVSREGATTRESPPGTPPPALHQVLPSGLEVQFSARETGRGGDETPPWALAYRTAEWDVVSPDQDPLEFQLYYRAEDEPRWHLLADEIEGPAYTWSTASFPDGLYRVRLVASDSSANAPGTARVAERLSPLFRVDHTAPEITRLELRRAGNSIALSAAARDAGGIARAGYALDGDDWHALGPDDGLFDEAEETFSITIDKPSPGEHTMALRVFDETGNLSVKRSTLAP